MSGLTGSDLSVLELDEPVYIAEGGNHQHGKLQVTDPVHTFQSLAIEFCQTVLVDGVKVWQLVTHPVINVDWFQAT